MDQRRCLKLPLGKLPPDILTSHVLGFTGAASDRVLVKPRVGIDFSAVRVPGGFMICSSDPVTGVSENIGWYAVNVSANDVATSGASPRFIQSVILLPMDASVRMLKEVARSIDRAARNLGIAVTGGHTEVTKRLDRPLVVTSCFGFTRKFVTSADAKVGDAILMTKTAGIEGTSILARYTGSNVSKNLVKRAVALEKEISIVKDAAIAFSTGVVNAMHDPTEGGVIGGAWEMAEASNLGFKVYEERIPIALETRAVCAALNLDPLRLIASGSLLLACPPGKCDEVLKTLRRNAVQAAVIGSFTKSDRVVVLKDGRTQRVEESVVDELWRIESEHQPS